MEFRLLVEQNQSSIADSITLEHMKWVLADALDISSGVPEYTCISYAWGTGRVPHPLTTAFKISDHSLPSLAATIRNHDCRRFWIDAFCIPPNNPQRSATLESMGFIYSRAKQVIAVLSRETFDCFVHLSRSESLDEPSLKVLDQDEWVSSVWTYQEVVNSQRLYFVCEDPSITSILAGMDFLDHLGYSIELYKTARNASTLDAREKFPRLGAFEDLLADYLTAGYQERSALQIMSNMDHRLAKEPKSRFYSMIGAITQERSQRSSHASITELSEAFMVKCEIKNDYSFIYSAANRDTLSGRRWRPIPIHLPSVLPWHGWGEAQSAYKDSEGLWLENMQRLELVHTVGEEATRKISEWMHQPEVTDWTEQACLKQLYHTLQRMGFTGSQEYLVTEDGLFFPQYPLLTHSEVTVLVPVALGWTLGAPGLVQVEANGVLSYIPGVFAGKVYKSKASAVLLRNSVTGPG